MRATTRTAAALLAVMAAAAAASAALPEPASSVGVRRHPHVFVPHAEMARVAQLPTPRHRAEALAPLLGRQRPGAAAHVLRDEGEAADGVLRSYAATRASGGLAASRMRANSMVADVDGVHVLGAYAIDVEVGDQTYEVLLDTGSSNLVVRPPASSQPVRFDSDACRACHPDGSSGGCPFGPPRPSSANATACGLGISYGGGSSFIDGTLYTDKVRIGSAVSVQGTLGGFHTQIPAGAFAQPPLEGIVGFAHELNAVNPTWAPTPFGLAVAAGQVENVFGLCLNATGGGRLDLGGADPQYAGDIKFAAGAQERWYQLDLLDIDIGGHTLGLPQFVYSYVNDQIGSFVDSGTSAFLVSPAAAQAVEEVFQSAYSYLPRVTGADSIFSGRCLPKDDFKPSQWPDITVTLRGDASGPDVKLTVPASSYFSFNGFAYCFAVQGVPGVGAILGDVVLTNYYTVHDRANNRVGFAPVRDCPSN